MDAFFGDGKNKSNAHQRFRKIQESNQQDLCCLYYYIVPQKTEAFY